VKQKSEYSKQNILVEMSTIGIINLSTYLLTLLWLVNLHIPNQKEEWCLTRNVHPTVSKVSYLAFSLVQPISQCNMKNSARNVFSATPVSTEKYEHYKHHVSRDLRKPIATGSVESDGTLHCMYFSMPNLLG